jgi:hypothetical protein
MWDSTNMHEPWNRVVMSSSSSVVEEEEEEEEEERPLPPSSFQIHMPFGFFYSFNYKEKQKNINYLPLKTRESFIHLVDFNPDDPTADMQR